MDDMEIFRDEHRQIAGLMNRFGDMLAEATPPEPLAFLHFRREFGRALSHHLKREDWMLYPRLRASPRPEVRNMAERLCTEIGAFEAAFAVYGRRWTSARICADWAQYRRESEAMILGLHRRILLEEQELYPLVDCA
jgi:hypothetical protein